MRDDQGRRNLSQAFSHLIERYQQHHRQLMEALYDDEVSDDAFEAMSAQTERDVNGLKRMKAELARQRAGAAPDGPEDDPAAG